MDLPLKIRDWPKGKRAFAIGFWKYSKPFIENERAVLVHRPRTITTFNYLGTRIHHAVEMHCGNTQTGDGVFRMHDMCPEEKVLCQKCEEMAVHRGLPSAEELCGRHVCIGGVKAVKSCCKD